ncbi:hypothetical protein N474_11355 [Pseudoalteromonas luteoviolacea CPMOR-2]|uniref:hypothetical protein n=1 Tax=Pseudoalteromonas luteoviolacea TaxID=43657 RepID=UPI0007B0AA48|nr:hypothetical protein [Pseudoalteromonas luteoviolacea]KZN56742.1 hypothetical protein N474_11355 [Pseudoalteromonas luteoviolacea CPMOR-2]
MTRPSVKAYLINKALSLALLSPFASYAVGKCIPDHCGSVYIERLYVEASGTIYIGTSGDEKVLNCQAVAGGYATIPAGTPGADLLYSTLLAAQMSNKVITTLQVDDNKPGCVVQYVTLDKQ